VPDVGTNVITGNISGSNPFVEAPVKVLWRMSDIPQYLKTQKALAPAIAVYAPGKKVLFCPKFVIDQQRQWAAQVASASRIYIIGLRVMPEDDHIWGELAKSRAHLCYVGLEPEEFNTWGRAQRRPNISNLASTFEAALPHIAKHMLS
jgi:hypothetical protein